VTRVTLGPSAVADLCVAHLDYSYSKPARKSVGHARSSGGPPVRAALHSCTSGMAGRSEVKVLRGSDGRNHKPKATAPPRGGVGRKPEAKPRPEGHEPHRRRGGLGESARRDEARAIKRPSRKCGGCAGKVAGLIRRGLAGRRPRRTSPDPGGRKAAGHPAGVSRGRISGRDRSGREGPNAKPRQRTLVLVGWTMSAANPAWRGLGAYMDA